MPNVVQGLRPYFQYVIGIENLVQRVGVVLESLTLTFQFLK